MLRYRQRNPKCGDWRWTNFQMQVALISMVAILMIPAKLATLGLLKIKVFWNKSYDFIISAHDVTYKILTRDSNYMVNVVMWPKFGNS